MKYCWGIMLVFCTLHLEAQTYEGTIGEYPVFLELDTDYEDKRATAFYFYKSQLRNIFLDGSQSDTEIVLFEEYSTKEKQKELFTLSLNGDKISGVWQNNGKTLKVNLVETQTNLETYKSLNFSFVRDSIVAYGKKELVWFTETHSQKPLFRLGNGFTKSERAAINPMLDSIHQDMAQTALDCYFADTDIEVNLVSHRYISFTEYSSVDCGGAHPSHSIRGNNFDLKSKLELGKLTEVYPNIDLYKLMKNKYGDDNDLDRECDYFSNYESTWDEYTWCFTPQGVVVTPWFPHAMTPCRVGFSLTYEELESGS